MLKDCPKNEQLAEKRSFKGSCEILRTIFQPRALSFDITTSWKGGLPVYSFYNPPNNLSRRTHVDRSCIFCQFVFFFFFLFLCSELSTTSFLISPSMASTKSVPLFSMTEKFSLNACSFLGLNCVEIKSDIKSDGGYHLITIVRFCITSTGLSNESTRKLFGGLELTITK